MTLPKGNKLFEVRSHTHAIGDTGDYDGFWEITNGKISLCTTDDEDDTEEVLGRIVKVINDSGIKFFLDDSEAQGFYYEGLGYKQQLQYAEAKAERLVKALEWAATLHKRNEGIVSNEDAAYGYDAFIDIARKALTDYRGKEGENG